MQGSWIRSATWNPSVGPVGISEVEEEEFISAVEVTADDEVISNEADDDKDEENEVDENDEAVDDVTSDDDMEEVTDDKDEEVTDITEEFISVVDETADDEVILNEAYDDKDGENEVDENDEAVDDDDIEEVTDEVANGERVTDEMVDNTDSVGITVEGVGDGNIKEFAVDKDVGNGEVIDIIEELVPDVNETDGVENESDGPNSIVEHGHTSSLSVQLSLKLKPV